MKLTTLKQKRVVGIVALLAVLILPATIPLWQPALVFTADGHLHLWRVYELDRALRQGLLYPRWAPDLFFGYGYPLFNFYPPLGYYTVETLHVLGLGLEAAFKVETALSLALAAGSMFLFARDLYAPYLKEDWQGDAAAILSAAAYVYAPYLMIDHYVRGAIAEALGYAVLPLYFWALRRLIRQPSLAYLLAAGAAGALLMLSHNLTAFFAAPLIVLFVLVSLVGVESSRDRLRALGYTLASGVMTLTLSAFYWLPALTEVRWVYIGQPNLTQNALRQSMIEHFQSLAAVIQPQLVYDYTEGPFPLGLTWVVLAISGLVIGLVVLKKRERLELAYWGLVVLTASLALTDALRGFWLSLPGLWVIQFAWRLTVFISLGGALTTGAWVVLLQRLRVRTLVTVGAAATLAALFVLSAVVNLQPKSWSTQMPAASNPEVLARYEVDVQVPGLSGDSEYLPAQVKNVPNPQVRRARVWDSPDTAPTTPPLADIQIESAGAGEWRMRVKATQATPISLGAFYYPDWQGWIDGTRVTTRATSRVGLVTIDVPGGEHEVQVIHASLPARDMSIAVSALAVLLVAAGCIASLRRGERSWGVPAAMAAMTLFIFAVPQLRVLSNDTPPLVPLQAQVDPTLRAIAASTDQLSPSTLRLRLLWDVQAAPDAQLNTQLRLVDSSGRVRAMRSMPPRYGVADARFWIPGEIVEDWYDLFLPDDLDRGEYRLEIRRGEGEWIELATTQLEGNQESSSPPAIPHPLDARMGDSIRLLGLDAPAFQKIAPGTLLPVTLYWSADKDVHEDYSVFVQLLDRNEKLAAQQDSLPNNGFTPSMLWAPNHVVADTHTLQLPPDLQPGVYQLIAGLYRFADLTRLAVSDSRGPTDEDFVRVGTIKIPADIPFTPDHTLGTKFGDAIELRGFTLQGQDAHGVIRGRAEGDLPAQLSTDGDSLRLQLAWFARQSPERDLTVFVHLVDKNGKLLAQQDSPPRQGYYPTSIWEQGERIVDEYRLSLHDVPAGDYSLYLGVYDSESGTRLPVSTDPRIAAADDRVKLARLIVTR